MPIAECGLSLEQYIDLVLLLSGSAFTVGVAEEQCSVPSVATTPDPHHVTAVKSAKPESVQHHNIASTSSVEKATITESCHDMAVIPESHSVMATSPEPLHKMATSLEPFHKMATTP